MRPSSSTRARRQHDGAAGPALEGQHETACAACRLPRPLLLMRSSAAGTVVGCCASSSPCLLLRPALHLRANLYPAWHCCRFWCQAIPRRESMRNCTRARVQGESHSVKSCQECSDADGEPLCKSCLANEAPSEHLLRTTPAAGEAQQAHVAPQSASLEVGGCDASSGISPGALNASPLTPQTTADRPLAAAREQTCVAWLSRIMLAAAATVILRSRLRSSPGSAHFSVPFAGERQQLDSHSCTDGCGRACFESVARDEQRRACEETGIEWRARNEEPKAGSEQAECQQECGADCGK